MRLKAVLFVSIMIGTLYADINDKIASNEKKITQKQSQEKKISHALDKIAGEINGQKRSLTKLIKEIITCKKSIKKLKKKTIIKGSELQKIEKIYKQRTKKEKIISKQVVNILSKELSIEMISTGAKDARYKDSLQNYANNTDDIIMNEVLHTYTTLLREKFRKTKSKYIKLNQSMDLVKNEIAKLSNKVDTLRAKKSDLNTLKKQKDSSLQTLAKKKKRYIQKLNRIKKEQNALSSTLSKLHVTKKRQDKTIIKETNTGSVNVRQIGSSYQHGKLVKYRGPKTIAPLSGYSVTQKFGNYTDPIYKIKIFNESVILRAKSQNAKVKNVLDGTVIYAEKTAVLDNVVIVKHKKNIHTIYAHLSQIAPTIRVGKRIKKAYVLGRVHRELTFEVTQDTKHINPLRLIK